MGKCEAMRDLPCCSLLASSEAANAVLVLHRWLDRSVTPGVFSARQYHSILMSLIKLCALTLLHSWVAALLHIAEPTVWRSVKSTGFNGSVCCGCSSASTSAPEQPKQRAYAEPDATLTRSVTYQYYERLPFCQPPDGRLVHKPATLGELVDGSRLVLTPYDIAFKQNRERAVLCTKALTRAEVKKFQAVRGRCGFLGRWLQTLLVALADAAGARRRSGTTSTSRCSLMSCPCGALWASWRK